MFHNEPVAPSPSDLTKGCAVSARVVHGREDITLTGQREKSDPAIAGQKTKFKHIPLLRGRHQEDTQLARYPGEPYYAGG